MRLRPFKLQQPVQDITVNDADQNPDPDASDHAYNFNNNFLYRNHAEGENHHNQYNHQDQKQTKQRVHITDDFRSLQPPEAQINQPTPNHQIRPHNQNNKEVQNNAIDPPTYSTTNNYPSSLPQHTRIANIRPTIRTGELTPPESSPSTAAEPSINNATNIEPTTQIQNAKTSNTSKPVTKTHTNATR